MEINGLNLEEVAPPSPLSHQAALHINECRGCLATQTETRDGAFVWKDSGQPVTLFFFRDACLVPPPGQKKAVMARFARYLQIARKQIKEEV